MIEAGIKRVLTKYLAPLKNRMPFISFTPYDGTCIRLFRLGDADFRYGLRRNRETLWSQ
jgi:hypothetical protein